MAEAATLLADRPAAPAADAPVEPKLYLRSLAVLVAEPSPHEFEIIEQILKGFRVRSVTRVTTAAEAKERIRREPPDMVIVGAALPEPDGYDFTRWMRTEKMLPCRTVPIVITTGHTRAADVETARSCGASYVVAKPVTAVVLFERIAWLARDRRAFVDHPAYCGPDRRFRNDGPPAGMDGRRKDDLSLDIGEPAESNMSQQEIDAMMNPKGALS